jgi:hypothetical protein
VARLVGIIVRNIGVKRKTDSVLLFVAIAFETLWVNGLLYKLKLLIFPSYIDHT